VFSLKRRILVNNIDAKFRGGRGPKSSFLPFAGNLASFICCWYGVKLPSGCNFSAQSSEKVISIRKQIDYLRSIHNTQANTEMKIAGVLPVIFLVLCAIECSVSGN